MRVLLIDYSEDTALALVELLDAQGHSVQFARDGAIGLQAAQEFHPDITILAMSLPDMSGYDVAFQLRHRCGLPNMPIIAIGDQWSDHVRNSQAGIDICLVKPVDDRAILELLNNHSAWIQLASHSDPLAVANHAMDYDAVVIQTKKSGA